MLLDDIRAYLIAQGVVSTGWKLYEGIMPDDSDQTIALFETGGLPVDTLGRENERPTFQSRVRGGRLDYGVAHAKWQQIENALQDAKETAGSPRLLPGFIFIQSAASGPLVFYDDKNRPNFISNWRVMKATATS